MRQFAYAAFNQALITAYATIAPGVPVVVGHPTPPAVLPPTCLRIYWLGYGGPGEVPAYDYATVQVDIFLEGTTAGQPVATALGQADALDKAIGVVTNIGLNTLDVIDYTTGAKVGRMSLAPDTAGWQNIQAATLRQVQLSRRVYLTWTT